jgi:hypothetical protein
MRPRPPRDRARRATGRRAVGRAGAAAAESRVALCLLSLLAGLWAWWAWRHGGYFPVDSYAGVLIVLALALTLLAAAPWRCRLTAAGVGALIAIGALAAWTLASALWTAFPDLALQEGLLVAGYAATFAVAAWVAHLLAPRPLALLVPPAAAAVAVALACVAAIAAGGDPSHYLDADRTLRFPLGYRNANAAFFTIALWPALALGSRRELAWLPRALLLGASSVLVELAALSQSRAWVIATLAAAAVYLAVEPQRARATAHLALVLAPAVVVLPSLLAVRAGSTSPGGELALLHHAMASVAASAAATAAIGGLVAWLEAHTRLPRSVRSATRQKSGRFDASRPVKREPVRVKSVAPAWTSSR